VAQGLPLFTVHGAHADRRRGDGQARVSPAARARPPVRERVAQAFTQVEDVLYVGIGVVLAVAALGLLINAAVMFARSIGAGAIGGSVVEVLDQLLLILMMIEILYTVQVSFREHVLVPEPFVLVAMIAAVRRILVLTAEFGKLMEQGDAVFRYAMIELGLLTAMTGVMVACLVGLRKRDKEAVAERA
jgi:uncharacterized membrane protein (DUF373 family)